MDDSTLISSSSNGTSSPNHHTDDHHSTSYPYKNEISLSINSDDDTASFSKPSSSSAAPTPSPRQQTEIPMPATLDDVPLHRNKTKPEEGKSGLDNPGFDAEDGAGRKGRPLSSFGHNNGNGSGNGLNDSTLGKKPINGKTNEKPVGKTSHCFIFYNKLHRFLINLKLTFRSCKS